MQFAARLMFLIAASTTPRVSTFSFSLLSLEIYKKVLSLFFPAVMLAVVCVCAHFWLSARCSRPKLAELNP